MTQNDQSNLPAELLPLQGAEFEPKQKREPSTNNDREWLPEDDDDWYEPDYCLPDRRQ